MKVGFSLSRCVKDIFDKKVSLDEIVVIITRTNFDPEVEDHWNAIWEGYTTYNNLTVPEWVGYNEYEAEFKEICIELKKSGKLHQPRQYGASTKIMFYHWYDLILTKDIVVKNEAAKKAWDNYKLIAGLS